MSRVTKTEMLIDGPKRNPLATIILAHGAGAPMDSDFMNDIANGLAEAKIQVVRFEFPYMQDIRATGKRKPPNGQKVLLEHWQQVIQLFNTDHLFIGGKSMGGRMASMIADQQQVSGLICLGYPFYAPGKPDNLRVEHLTSMKTSTLIIQGVRDPFGNQEEVEKYKLSKRIKVKWLPDGDHSFKPRKKSGITSSDNLSQAIEYITDFVCRW